MKKILGGIVLSLVVFMLTGCANGKYKGWEQVRIEGQVPQKDCVYKTQEGCGSSNCFNWFKKRATKCGANVVILKSLSKSKEVVGGTFVSNGSGFGGVGTVDTMSGLADFYYCPNYKYTGEASVSK